MASAGGVLGRCCGSGLGSAGAPSSQGLWGRPRSTGASGCRRRMRGPRCWGRARASVPAPWRARVGDDQETALGHAAGRAGMPCPRWGLRQSSGAPLSSLRSSATPKARMRQVRSHNVTDDSGSPEGCSQPSSPPLCGGVMTMLDRLSCRRANPLVLSLSNACAVASVVRLSCRGVCRECQRPNKGFARDTCLCRIRHKHVPRTFPSLGALCWIETILPEAPGKCEAARWAPKAQQ